MVDFNEFMESLGSESISYETLVTPSGEHFTRMQTPDERARLSLAENKTPEQRQELELQKHFKLQKKFADSSKEIKSNRFEADLVRARLVSNVYEGEELESLKLSREALEKFEPIESLKKKIIIGQIRLFFNLESLMDCYRVIDDDSYLLDSCTEIFDILAKKKRGFDRPVGWIPFVEKVLTSVRKQSNFRRDKFELPAAFHRLCQENLNSPIVRSIYIEELCKPGAKNATIEMRMKSLILEPRDFMFVKDWLTKTEHNISFSVSTSFFQSPNIAEMSLVLQEAIVKDRIDYRNFRLSFSDKTFPVVRFWNDSTLKKFLFNSRSDIVENFPFSETDVAKRRVAHSVYFDYVLPLLALELPPYVICWIVEEVVKTEHYPHFYGIKLIEKMRDMRKDIFKRREATRKKKFVIELSK